MRQEIPSYRLYLSTQQQRIFHWNEALECSFSELHELFHICQLEWVNRDRGKEIKGCILIAERCSRTQLMLILKMRSKIGLKWDISG